MRIKLFTKVQNLYSLTHGPGKCPMVGCLDKRDRVLNTSNCAQDFEKLNIFLPRTKVRAKIAYFLRPIFQIIGNTKI